MLPAAPRMPARMVAIAFRLLSLPPQSGIVASAEVDFGDRGYSSEHKRFASFGFPLRSLPEDGLPCLRHML
jgi:hypothetical protein